MKKGDLVKYTSSYTCRTQPMCGIIIDVDKDYYQWRGYRQDRLEVFWNDPEGILTRTYEPVSHLEIVSEKR